MQFKMLPKCVKKQAPTLIALLSILTGVVGGVILRYTDEWRPDQIVWIALPGDLFMRMLTCLSMPLVLPKLVTAIGSMDPVSGGKILFKVLIFYGILNLIIESTGILIFYAINSSASPEEVGNSTVPENALPPSLFLHDLFFNMVPDNIFTAPFQRYQTKIVVANETISYTKDHADNNNILGLVVAATALGLMIAKLGDEAKPLLHFFSSLSRVTSEMMNIVIKWMCPPGLISLVASQIVVLHDPVESLKELTMFLITMVAGNLVLPLFVLPLIYIIFTRSNPFIFFYNLGEALIMMCGTSSSIATFPVTLRCLTHKNHTDPTVSSMVLSVGVLINLCSYPMVAVLYVARQEGMGLNINQIVVTMIILVIIVYGTSGIPQDSFMTVLLLCGMHGIPTTKLANVLAVDWLLDRIDGLCKVLTDSTAVAVICHLENRGEPDNDTALAYEQSGERLK